MALVQTELDSRGVFTITLDDPNNRNALSRQLTIELIAAIDRVAEDDEIRLAVLTNTGKTFCAGADLRERSTGGDNLQAPDPLALFRGIIDSPKPWVGRIAGHAVAGGLGLAAALDLSVIDETAKMGFTEVRIGVAPAIISVICLPKMRRSEAAAAMLRGRRFDGAEGARLGLVNAAVPPAELDGAVDAIVDDVLAGGPEALTATKSLLRTVPTLDRDTAFSEMAALSARLFENPEAQEGMAAFRDGRRPGWSPDGPTTW